MTQQQSMADKGKPALRSTQWNPIHAYSTAFVCLVLGLLVGYLVRGSASATGMSTVQTPVTRTMPERSKAVADKQAEPLLARLQTDPTNHDLLIEIANVYSAAHRKTETVQYLQAALKVEPNDAETRIQLGNLYFYSGETREAIAEFQRVLESDPANADGLFNIGMVKWQAYKDINGAVSSWKMLLARNPKHPKRHDVERLIAQAQKHAKAKPSRDLTK